MRQRALAALAAILAAVALGACGGGTEYDASGRPPGGNDAAEGGAHAGHGGAAGAEQGAAAEGGAHAGHGGASGERGDDAAEDMADMEVLAISESEDLRVELHAMAPELFYVSEGDGLRPHRPTKDDDAHLMVTLADRSSGIRLPDATVTLRLSDAGGATAFEGPLYPMVGRGMGLHYGENVDVDAPGTYEVRLTVGPPRVGRHRAVAEAWTRTVTIRQKVRYDGTAFTKA
jgi:hypothetical protein